jgi:hypothetical protein
MNLKSDQMDKMRVLTVEQKRSLLINMRKVNLNFRRLF